MADSPSPRVLIVGGVAAGASCAARLRRANEQPEIVLFDRGPFVSFANCGLPYYVGNVIPDERKLLVASRELFRERFNVDVQIETDVLAIDRAAQTIRVRHLPTGVERDERYDSLVLAPGAAPIRPDVPGLDLPGVMNVRTIPDSRRIRSWIDKPGVTRAVVIGGGFIGLEMVENLHRRDLTITLVEKGTQVLPSLDPEMALPLRTHLNAAGVQLFLGEGVTGIERRDDETLIVSTDAGRQIETDLVIVAIGVKPETGLAQRAGLTLGARGGVVVDEEMRTSDPHIWAVGDVIEVPDLLTGQETILPLAGPANRQGRVAAESIAGLHPVFRGVQATAVVGMLDLVAASTGVSEKGLRRSGITDFGRIYLHPGHHANYYPGASPIHIKVIFSLKDGRVLGAQAVGRAGVEKRIDVIATMIQFGGTVHDMAEAELCYAPQFGAAKDPVNVAGMIAQHVLSGESPLADWLQVHDTDALIVDVREPAEYGAGHVAGSVNIPLHTLRKKHAELPRDRPIWVSCGVGQRAYYGVRFLRQHGFDAYNLSGGYTTYKALVGAGVLRAAQHA